MVLGICCLDLLLHGNHSLKEKRHILRTLSERVKARFNVSIAEVGDMDLWQRAKIGCAVVGTDHSHLNSSLDKMVNFIEDMNLAEIIDSQVEIIHY